MGERHRHRHVILIVTVISKGIIVIIILIVILIVIVIGKVIIIVVIIFVVTTTVTKCISIILTTIVMKKRNYIFFSRMCKSSRWEAGTTESSLLLHQGNISHHLTNIRVSNRTLGLRSSCCHGPHMTGSSPSTASCISFVSFS